MNKIISKIASFFEILWYYAPVLGIGIIVLAGVFATGMMYSESHQTAPGDKQNTLSTIESSDAEKAQFCSSLMVQQECMPDVRYYETIVPCDCTIEMEVGRVNGWAECVEAEQAVTSQKYKGDYCDAHYCQEKILRNTRPTTK